MRSERESWQVAEFLTSFPDEVPKQTLPQLMKLLSSKNPVTRHNAGLVIQHYSFTYPELGFARFRPALVAVLNDPSDLVRIRVATILHNSDLSGPEVFPALQRALTNSDPSLYRLTGNFLKRLRGKDPIEFIE